MSEVTPSIIRLPKEMVQWADIIRKRGESIGFVPTLGNLHKGHRYLMQALRGECDRLVVSIFINPTQFAADEDYKTYPRTEQEDLQICEEEKVDLVFIPRAEDIYLRGTNPLTQVDIPSMTGLHCGVSRPPHFIGVLTVVNLLFNLVKPHSAAFGKKDFQQLHLVKLMVQELHIPVEIVSVETGRTDDGLALSSRNRYLTSQERDIAPQFYATLCMIAEKIKQGARDYRLLELEGTTHLDKKGMKVDYIHISRCEDLLPAHKNDKDIIILGAIYLGKSRLIDNVPLSLV